MKMKNRTITLIFLFIASSVLAQKISSGAYDLGLKLAFDNKSNKLSGYFENYTGWDEDTKSARFSCIFYIEGTVEGLKVKIKTYFPTDKKEDIIEGNIEIVNNKSVKIKLPEEHGGCWNVQHFADEAAKFDLQKSTNWIQIRYTETDKTYFYNGKSIDKKSKAYLVKGDFVCIDKIDGDWAYCTYFGKRTTSGWIQLKDLNKL
jgi:hypothetical protein